MSYGFSDDPEVVARETSRLTALAACRDPRTRELLARCGVGPGAQCLEVGAGTGSIARWLGEQVGAHGYVLSTDIDLRFHQACAPPVEVRVHDIVHDPLDTERFDLVHARGVLQHIAEREQVLERLVDALKPGGWLVVEDSDFTTFAEQPLPEPLATFHELMASGALSRHDHDTHFGTRCLQLLRAFGLADVEVDGTVWTMRGNEPSGEWWFLALEHTAGRLIEAGALSQGDVERALGQARAPGFAMLSPVSLATIGRRPR